MEFLKPDKKKTIYLFHSRQIDPTVIHSKMMELNIQEGAGKKMDDNDCLTISLSNKMKQTEIILGIAVECKIENM